MGRSSTSTLSGIGSGFSDATIYLHKLEQQSAVPDKVSILLTFSWKLSRLMLASKHPQEGSACSEHSLENLNCIKDFAIFPSDIALGQSCRECIGLDFCRHKDSGKPRGFAFLAYEDQKSTNLAVDNLNGTKVGGRMITVDHVENYKRKRAEVRLLLVFQRCYLNYCE